MAVAPIALPGLSGAVAQVPARLPAGLAIAFASLLEDELSRAPPTVALAPPPPATNPAVLVPGLVAGYVPVWPPREPVKRPEDPKRRRPPKRQ